MATLNPQTEALALAQRLIDDAQDAVEARTAVFLAASVLQSEVTRVTQIATEETAELVLQARAVKGGKSVDDQKAEVALALNRHPSTVKAAEVTDALVFDLKADTKR